MACCHDSCPLLFLTQTPDTADNVLFKCSEHSSARHQPRCSFIPTWRSMSTLKTEARLPNKWDHPWSTWMQHETITQVVYAKCDNDTVDQFKTRFLILCCIFMILNTFPFFTLSVALWSLHSADTKKPTNVLSHVHTGPFNKGWWALVISVINPHSVLQ